MENAEKFEAAIKAMPTQAILKTLVFEASMFAQARASRRPTEMGMTPGTSGDYSTGNVPTPLRTYWQRGKGSRYVPGRTVGNTSESTGRTRRRASGARSENLKNRWRRERNSDSTVVEVFTSVTYAKHVQGGKADEKSRSRVMEARGWESIDEVGEAVEENIGKVMQKTVARLYQQFLTKYGISSTVSGT